MSDPVPQQPVERWTIRVCPRHGESARQTYFECCGTLQYNDERVVEVVPALVAELLAEALRELVDEVGNTEAYMRNCPEGRAFIMSTAVDPISEVAIKARAALEVYESGGATKPRRGVLMSFAQKMKRESMVSMAKKVAADRAFAAWFRTRDRRYLAETQVERYREALERVKEAAKAERLTPDQWKVVLDAATSYDRRLPQGQGSPEIEAVLRALAGSVGEPE